MTTASTQDVLAEVWAIKDSLSARHGHSLKATCRAMYAEQQKHPGDFVNLGAKPRPNNKGCIAASLSEPATTPLVEPSPAAMSGFPAAKPLR